MNKLFYYTQSKRPETRKDIKPYMFASLKAATLTQCYADVHSKLTAYNYLIEHKFNVPKEHEIWRIIDEPYEYYQNIANSNQLLDDQQDQK